MHSSIKSVTFTPTGKTAEDLEAIRAARAPIPTLTGWDVKRSGPSLTVTGEQGGHPERLTGVCRVNRLPNDDGRGQVVALDPRGVVMAYLA